MKQRNGTRRAARGMTLIEILVVLVLIGIVMGIVGGNFLGKAKRPRPMPPRSRSTRSAQTLDLYKLEIGRYPTTQEGLAGAAHGALRASATGTGPYWKNGTLPKDPWGKRVSTPLRAPRARTTSFRTAPDGKEGGDGPNKDITSY